MDFLNLTVDSLYLIWVFVVPGFIAIKFRDLLTHSDEGTDFSLLIESILHSFVIVALFLEPLAHLGIGLTDPTGKYPTGELILSLFAISLLWGLLLTLFRQGKPSLMRCLRWLRLTDSTGHNDLFNHAFPSNKTTGVLVESKGPLVRGKAKFVPTNNEQSIILDSLEVLSKDSKWEPISGNLLVNCDLLPFVRLYHSDGTRIAKNDR